MSIWIKDWFYEEEQTMTITEQQIDEIYADELCIDLEEQRALAESDAAMHALQEKLLAREEAEEA